MIFLLNKTKLKVLLLHYLCWQAVRSIIYYGNFILSLDSLLYFGSEFLYLAKENWKT